MKRFKNEYISKSIFYNISSREEFSKGSCVDIEAAENFLIDHMKSVIAEYPEIGNRFELRIALPGQFEMLGKYRQMAAIFGGDKIAQREFKDFTWEPACGYWVKTIDLDQIDD